MNIDELHPKLRRPYRTASECGIAKSKDCKNGNLYFVVPPMPPDKIIKGFSIKKLNEAASALHRMPSFDEMDDLDKLINYLFIRREAVQSSRLEGTWSTIDEVLTPKNDEPVSMSTLSVRGYAHSLESLYEYAYKTKESVFNLKNILKIHKEIMSKDPDYKGTPGKLRTPGKPGSVVYIGGVGRPENSIYNPTPPEYVDNSLNKLLGWFSNREITELGDAGMGLSLPIRMAVGHSHFESIHPFTDGNGRVGRALWPLQMIASNYMPLYLSGYVEIEKHEYSNALQLAQKKLDYSKIIDFLSCAIISSAHEMNVTKEKLLSLPGLWQLRGNFRTNSAASNALYALLEMPMFRMEDLRSKLNCSIQAASVAIRQLVEAKVIRERTGNKRNRLFAAEEVIALLSREHGSDPEVALDGAFE